MTTRGVTVQSAWQGKQAIKSDELSVDLWGCHPQEEYKINIEDTETQSQRGDEAPDDSSKFPSYCAELEKHPCRTIILLRKDWETGSALHSSTLERFNRTH